MILFIVLQYAVPSCIIFSVCSRTIKQRLSANIHILAAPSAFFSGLKSSRDNGLQGESKQIIQEQHNSSEQVGSMDSTSQVCYTLVRNLRGAIIPCQGQHEQHVKGSYSGLTN